MCDSESECFYIKKQTKNILAYTNSSNSLLNNFKNNLGIQTMRNK